MSIKNRIATPTLVLLAAGMTLAHAQETLQGHELTASQVLQKLETQGYTKIEDLERERDYWEVEATKPDGTRVDLHVSATDGRIIREERDND